MEEGRQSYYYFPCFVQRVDLQGSLKKWSKNKVMALVDFKVHYQINGFYVWNRQKTKRQLRKNSWQQLNNRLSIGSHN